MSKKEHKVLVGHIGVDSGQVMIVDPCYLNKWVDNEFRCRVGIRNKDSGRVICCWDEIGDGIKINWATPLQEFGGKCMNDLAQDKKNWEKYEEYPDKGEFNYSGVSSVTCQENFGEIGDATAVVSSTYMGDGCYPVFAITEGKGGRVKRLVIEFAGSDEDDDCE